jgi:hypothetical protein
MAQTFTGRKRVRKFFGKIREVAEMPNLIEVQKASYDQFLQLENPKGDRNDDGLQAVFKSVFPISDFSGTAMLEFVRYEFEPPKYDVDECRQRGMTFAAPLKVTLRLIVFDVDPETQAKSVKDSVSPDRPSSNRLPAGIAAGATRPRSGNLSAYQGAMSVSRRCCIRVSRSIPYPASRLTSSA